MICKGKNKMSLFVRRKSKTIALIRLTCFRTKTRANTTKWFRSICLKFHLVFPGRKVAKKKFPSLLYPDNFVQLFRQGRVESSSEFSAPKKIRMPEHPSASTLTVEFSRSGKERLLWKPEYRNTVVTESLTLSPYGRDVIHGRTLRLFRYCVMHV